LKNYCGELSVFLRPFHSISAPSPIMETRGRTIQGQEEKIVITRWGVKRIGEGRRRRSAQVFSAPSPPDAPQTEEAADTSQNPDGYGYDDLAGG